MFQYDWFEKKNYSHKDIPKNIPEGYINKNSIESIKKLFWEEHCLECAMPLCYHNCEKYAERKDGRCKKTHYGIYKGKKRNTLQNATLKFKSWGKIEAVLSPRAISPKMEKFRDNLNHAFSRLLKLVSIILKPINKKYLPTNGWSHILRNNLKKCTKPNKRYTPYFLFQCYSYETKEYNMFFELSFNGQVYFKKAFKIKEGFNQHLCYIDEFKYGNESLVKLYPENNINAELTILALDFVGLNYKNKKPAKKVKCVAWDLDNTIWNGILIESNPEKLRLKPDVLDLLKELDKKGIIQIVVSKNTLSDIEPVLKRLKIDHFFVYKFANWNSKSNNLIAASNALNINIDTFALIDDSDIERREIAELLPCVRVYRETNLSNLLILDEFNVPITEDSIKRREMYQTEARRKDVEKEFIGTNLGFLRSCEIVIEISSIATEKQFDRAYELTHRTNQLNLSGKKHEKEHLRAMISSNNSFTFSCHDKYGAYGTVGFILFENTKSSILINEFAMSCRVASKCVESSLINWLQNKYHKTIIMSGSRTDRNNLLIDTFMSVGFESLSDSKIELLLSANKHCNNFDVVAVKDNTTNV